MNNTGAASITANTLRCENQSDPIGIDRPHPRLSWILSAVNGERGEYQSAFRIQVATRKELLRNNRPDLWDSGTVDTSLSNNVVYDGRKLGPETSCFWRVKIWNKRHKASGWSEIASWGMGLLSQSDWKGNWIEETASPSRNNNNVYDHNPAPLFRRDFRVSKTIKKAVMYVAGLGYYEAFINGTKVGRNVLDPGWTDYSKRILYSTYDVTSYLKSGSNCIGMLLGNGWYNPLPLKMWGRINIREALPVGTPKFIMQLNIEYNSGKRDQITSDERWQSTPGPIVRNSVYLGEWYDARKEVPLWNKPGAKLAGWQQVKLATAPAGNMQSQRQPPIIAGDTLSPIAIKKNSSGNYIIDFGRNFAGVIRIRLNGKSGTLVAVRYGELLYPDGSLNVMTSTAGQIKQKGTGGPGSPDTAYAKDVFILDGNGTETFQPRFTFHGFRYIEVTGYGGTLKNEDIKGIALYSDVSPAGKFVCSDSLLNEIQKICINTFRSNLFSVQSDCPHRERFGYGGDIVATCDAFLMNFDMSSFYEKTVNDFADEERPDGGLTETAPFVGIASDGLADKSGPVEWGSVLPVLLFKLYQYNGNIELIRQTYPIARNWVDFIHDHSKNNLVTTTIGDHESIDPPLVELSATAFYYYNTHLLTTLAHILHKKEDVGKYSRLADTIKQAFLAKFLDPSSGNVGIHTAAAQAYALYFHLVPQYASENVLRVLLKDIADSNYHVTSGIFGTNFLFHVLGQTQNGRIAYQIATQKTFPGWGYMISKGATTLWEHWAFSDNTYSHNHPMFGSISNWFYNCLAGIQPAEDAVGYNRIIIEPDVKNLEWAKATYNSPLGKVSSSWKKTGTTFALDITIPVNATATVVLPSEFRDIKEGGTTDYVSDNDRLAGELSFQLGSGTYHFTADMPVSYR